MSFYNLIFLIVFCTFFSNVVSAGEIEATTDIIVNFMSECAAFDTNYQTECMFYKIIALCMTLLCFVLITYIVLSKLEGFSLENVVKLVKSINKDNKDVDEYT